MGVATNRELSSVSAMRIEGGLVRIGKTVFVGREPIPATHFARRENHAQ